MAQAAIALTLGFLAVATTGRRRQARRAAFDLWLDSATAEELLGFARRVSRS